MYVLHCHASLTAVTCHNQYLLRAHREGRGFGSGGFGSRREEGDREGGDRDEDAGPSRADTADDWGASRQFVPSSARSAGSAGVPSLLPPAALKIGRSCHGATNPVRAARPASC